MWRIVWLGACGLVAGCASQYEPVVDLKGVDTLQYMADLQECRHIAERVDMGASTAMGALGGAAVGAGTGAAIGAVTGAPGRGAAIGGAGGGSLGFFGGLFGGAEKERSVVRNCLAGRGYRVLE